MARRKNPEESREALMFRLDALEKYISHHEQKLDQFEIALRRIEILQIGQIPCETSDLLNYLIKELANLWSADPRKTHFENELAEARASINAEHDNSDEYAEVKSKLIEAGFRYGSEGPTLDFVLTSVAGDIIKELGSIGNQITTGGQTESLQDRLRALMDRARQLFDCALEPARFLRQQWIDRLNGLPENRPRKKRGRPKDPSVAARDRRIFEVWSMRNNLKYAELTKEFGCSEDTIRKAVKKFKRRSGAPRGPSS
jgi:hypothetical protein